MADIPYGYCQCGCGQRAPLATVTRTRGNYVKGEPVRFIQGHSLRRHNGPAYVVGECDCWVWQHARSSDGYGVMYPLVEGKRRQVRAHRVYYEQRFGPIPDGLVIDHLCCNKLCVNPAHMELVTTGVNVLRGVDSPPAQNVRKTHCVNGHPFDEGNTGTAGVGVRRCRACSREATRRAAAKRGEAWALGTVGLDA